MKKKSEGFRRKMTFDIFDKVAHNFGENMILILPKDCSSKFRSKHSTVLVLCLLRNLLEQSLSSTYFG